MGTFVIGEGDGALVDGDSVGGVGDLVVGDGVGARVEQLLPVHASTSSMHGG